MFPIGRFSKQRVRVNRAHLTCLACVSTDGKEMTSTCPCRSVMAVASSISGNVPWESSMISSAGFRGGYRRSKSSSVPLRGAPCLFRESQYRGASHDTRSIAANVS